MADDSREEEDWIIVPILSGDNLEVWIHEIEDLMLEYQVPSIQYVNFAHVYVKGSARDWVGMHLDEICQMDWYKFVHALRVEFGTACVEEEVIASLVEENKVIEQIDFSSQEGYIQGTRDKGGDIQVRPESDLKIDGKLITSSYMRTQEEKDHVLVPDNPSFTWEPGPNLVVPYIHPTVKSIRSLYNMNYLSELQYWEQVFDKFFWDEHVGKSGFSFTGLAGCSKFVGKDDYGDIFSLCFDPGIIFLGCVNSAIPHMISGYMPVSMISLKFCIYHSIWGNVGTNSLKTPLWKGRV